MQYQNNGNFLEFLFDRHNLCESVQNEQDHLAKQPLYTEPECDSIHQQGFSGRDNPMTDVYIHLTTI